MPQKAAIYARISSDQDGAGAGVRRQVEDCRRKAESLGWTVAGEYVDNDLSAYSGKPRPEYQRMLADVADGVIDGVLVYNLDRLTRRPAELEAFADAMTAAGVRQVKFVTGDLDMGTDDGLMMARIMGAFAAKESANIGRRVRRKMDEVAAEGRPHGGSTRPYGYASDFVTVVPEEAEVIGQIVARFLAGESSRSIATWLNDQGVRTVRGKPWVTSTLKGILTNPRYAGLRAHRGEVVGPAVWEAIISEEDHRRILATYAEKKLTGRRAPQRYLLSGLCRCSKCGNRLYSSARVRDGKDTRRYVCMKGPDHGGCGRLTVTAQPLELMVADLVLYRLDTPELADALAGRASIDDRARALSEELDEVQSRLEDLATEYARGEITRREWKAARVVLDGRQQAIQRQLSQTTQTNALHGLPGNGSALAESWGTLNLDRQHAIVKALVDHVVIRPGTAGVVALDPARVEVVWRH